FMAGLVKQLAGLEQRLGWNAAGVETRAPERRFIPGIQPFVNTSYRHVELCGTNSRHIAGRACPDYDDVEFFTHGGSWLRAKTMAAAVGAAWIGLRPAAAGAPDLPATP